ncbi:hypothetical protein EZV62_002338 [Acer yangbiense]|uniref:Uncharacterized protein n=1 Tax=Acer yangbiense TaxID=1000413 RepID=A0A5C7IXD7_9ROSI|nr:hypothetical protein EZV62_002338 [Acer yangbiense]
MRIPPSLHLSQFSLPVLSRPCLLVVLGWGLAAVFFLALGFLFLSGFGGAGHEAAAMAVAQVAFVLQSGQHRGVQFTIASGPAASLLS